MGAGKTTVLLKLKEIFSFPIIAIDDYRRQYGKGNIESELEARNKFITAIHKDENQFIECLGVGKVADSVFELLKFSSEPVICLILCTPKEICKIRLSDRKWDIPYPEPIEKTISLLERTDLKIRSKAIIEKWNSRINTIILERNNINQDDLENIKSDLIKLIRQNL